MGIKRAFIAIFFAIIILLSLFTLVLPKKSHSELENRDLQKTPVFSIDSIKSKRFMKDTETFLADHMVGRTYFVKAKTALEMAMGKREINGVYIADDRLMEVTKDVPLSATDPSVAAINDFAQRYKDKLSVYAMLIPSASEFFSDKLPAFSMPLDQTQRIKSIYDQMENVNRIDVYASLASNTSGYIYYRTDHHWTTGGAFYGYEAFCETAGIEPALPDESLKNSADGFYGTYFSKAKNYNAVPDTVTWFDFPVSSVTIDGKPYDGLYDLSCLEKRDKYAMFLYANNGVTVIENEAAPLSKTLFVIKDSYANCFAPYLTQNYQKLVVVDLRSLPKGLNELIAAEKGCEVLVLYSFSNLSSDTNLPRIRY